MENFNTENCVYATYIMGVCFAISFGIVLGLYGKKDFAYGKNWFKLYGKNWFMLISECVSVFFCKH